MSRAIVDYAATARYYEAVALVAAGEAPAPPADGSPQTTTNGVAPSPWFGALVDGIDHSAVLNLIAIVPGADAQSLRAFERKGGGWVEAPDIMRDIRGLTPPPLVELDRETLLAVVEQMDQYDSDKIAEEAQEGAPA